MKAGVIMNFRVLSGLIGLVLLVGFLLPPVIKLKELPLALVVLVGVAMAAYELFENVRGKGD